MEPTKCISSYLTTALITFRNPNGSEENWIQNGPVHVHTSSTIYYGKLITTEIGALLLCITAAVEAIAYTVLAAATIPLMIVSPGFNKFFFDLTLSAGVTLFWNAILLAFLPSCKEDTVTREVFFRSYLNASFFRHEDVMFILGWLLQRQNLILNTAQTGDLAKKILLGIQLLPVIKTALDRLNHLVSKDMISEGSSCFKEDILPKVDSRTKELIQSFDADICHFILTKTVYIYVFGEKKGAPLPGFLKEETQKAIEGLRTKYSNILEQAKALESVMENHLLFNQDQTDPFLKEVFNDLKLAASKELQKTLFLTQCWKKALT